MNKKAKVEQNGLEGRILARVFGDDLSKVMGAEGDVISVSCGPGCDELKGPASVKLTEDSW